MHDQMKKEPEDSLFKTNRRTSIY